MTSLNLNLGILAHVDAGKTSLTERLLFEAGVTGVLGSVDAGSTRTDSLDLERRRGITIKSAVVPFLLNGVGVNLIDTPGHPDFIAEVERVLGVLDGAILVVSAVEGVQAQTRILLRSLHRLGVPVLIFVNKVDRAGARFGGLLDEMAARLSPCLVPMSRVENLGTRGAKVSPEVDMLRLADFDEGVLAAYVKDQEFPPVRAQGRTHPVYFGSAITGAGVDALMTGITELLPAAEPASGELDGVIFKIDRQGAYARLFAGELPVRSLIGRERVTAVDVFAGGGLQRRDRLVAGEIGLLHGPHRLRIGDPLGAHRRESAFFAPPTLETVVEPAQPQERAAVHAALSELADADPLIGLRQDDVRRELSVSLYGEVQKEVIEATLAEQYGLPVTFRESTTLCVERLTGTGEANEVIAVAPNPYLATVGLRVEPGEPGGGVRFRLGVELGSMPLAFFTAVEETVHETLTQGLHGWPVPDAVVTMTRSGYYPRQSHSHAVFDKSMSSTAGDFRMLTPLVLMTALREAGTRVLEPWNAFTAEIPPDSSPAVLLLLGRLGGIPFDTSPAGIAGEIPASRVHELRRSLPGLTRGEGVVESAFCRYEAVRGPAPSRARIGVDPLERREYLRVMRR